MSLRLRTALAVLVCFVCLGGLAFADTPAPADPNNPTAAEDGLGLPSIPIENGTHMIGDGVGMFMQPGTVTLPAIPAGATIKQVLLYWGGFHNTPTSFDDTITVHNGVVPPMSVTGTKIGGPTLFYQLNFNTIQVYSSTFRADITGLNLISPGVNTLIFSDLDFGNPLTAALANGASVLVTYDDNASQVFELGIRDGQDLAFINFAPPLDGVTDPQTFTYAPSAVARTATLHLIAGSVEGPASMGPPVRPNVLRTFIDGSATPQDVYVDFFSSSDGDEWDHITLEVDIPAGSTSLTVQAFSETDGTPNLPASFTWQGVGFNILPSLSSIGDTVYCDLNDNGVQDPGEPGEPGITVNLSCLLPDGSTLTDSQVTDASGNYLFTGIEGGAVCDVSIDPTTVPANKEIGVCPTPLTGITLVAGTAYLDADFCVRFLPGNIGDTVYCDLNNNGVQDPGEPGEPGITVNLSCLLPDGTTSTASQMTNSTGNYLFTNIPAGAICTVGIDPLTVPANKEVGVCPTPLTGIVVPANDSFLDADFCVRFLPGNIGDTVYCDLNDNGVQDPGEPGEPGITVNLSCLLLDGTTLTNTDTTDASGNYLFMGIPAGAICMVSIDPATVPTNKEVGVCPTPITNITVQAGSSFLDADFCIRFKPGNIGDTVYCDLNNNGVQDPGEPGEPGITVNLSCLLPDGTTSTASQMTNSTGNYLFTNIPAGAVCTVGIDPLTVPANKEVGVCPTPLTGITVPANDSFLDADFCVRFLPGNIGDTVYCDLNNNGVQDPGEPGEPGITVNLSCLLPDGTTSTASQMTNSTGNYLFSNIPAGAICTVGIDPLTVPANKEVGVCPTPLTGIVVPANDSFLDADFCVRFLPGNIGDTVYCDLNNNGTQDPGEPGEPGITVNLSCTLPDGTTLTDSQVTDGTGNYLFTGIPADAVCTVGIDPATVPSNKEVGVCPTPLTGIVVPANDSYLDADFCVRFLPGSIGDTVYCDLNNNGTQDPGEPGEPGITVNLSCLLPDGTTSTASQMTNSTGNYLFTNIPAGAVCTVGIDPLTVPANKEVGVCPTPLTGIVVPANDSYLDADFCVRFLPGNIGDTVYCDLNDNGVQDPGEPGEPGITVNLSCLLPDGTTSTASQMTNSNGNYLFTNIPAGAVCTVGIDPLTVPFNKEVGVCPTPLTGIVVPANDSYLDADFCVRFNPGQIGDLVYCDLDDDSMYDPGEPGLPGVEVTLTCAGPDGMFGTADDVTSTTTTDVNGMYLFTNVDPGMCNVEVDQFSPALGDKVPCTSVILPVDLAPGETYLDADFCFVEQPCAECDGGVSSLTLSYDGTAPATIRAEDGDGVRFEGLLNPGDTFYVESVGGPTVKFDGDVDLFIDGVLNFSVHVSCSQPVGPGTVFGSFTSIAATSKNNGPVCPAGPCDSGKPCALTMRYTGQDCTFTSHTQDPGKVSCSGDPGLAPIVQIRATDSSNPNDSGADVWFDGQVNLNDPFLIEAANAGATKLQSATFVYVYDLSGNLLQSIEFHTSCSQPLNLGDQFGSLVLEDFAAEGSCAPGTGGPDLCDAGKPCGLTLLYTGDDCMATSHTQDPGKVNCSGDPNFASTVYVLSTDSDDPKDTGANVWFAGEVDLDTTFDLSSLAAGENRLKSETFVYIYDLAGVLLQSVEFHTSCSQPLQLDDQFGAVQLVDFTVEGECVAPPPGPGTDLCTDRPCALLLEYTGDSCMATSHAQDPGKVSCTGDPAFAQTVWIRASDKGNPNDSSAKVWFENSVMLNEAFEIRAFAAGEDEMKSETFIHIFDMNGNPLQMIEFHTSCSQPLRLDDQFGGIKLLGFTPKGSCQITAADDQCMLDKPQVLTMRYTGEDCMASSFGMDPGKVQCSGDPAGALNVVIRASDKSNPYDGGAKVWFHGPVALSGQFDIDATAAGENRLKKDTWVHIFDASRSTVLQTIKFKTDCGEPLFIGDQFGAVVIEAYTPEP